MDKPAGPHLPTDAALLADPAAPYIHRDMSWLQFNGRVLAEAECADNPLLERLKFLAITATNLDEFFMIRFSSMQRNLRRAARKELPNEKRLRRVRGSIVSQVQDFIGAQHSVLRQLKKVCAANGIQLVADESANAQVLQLGRSLFDRELLPHLAPSEELSTATLATLENLQTALVCGKKRFLRMPRHVPAMLVVQHEDQLFAFFTDGLLQRHAAEVLQLEGEVHLLRLTRDGDINVDLTEDPEAMPDIVRRGLVSRERALPMRAQCCSSAPAWLHELIAQAFKLEPLQIMPTPATLGLHGLWQGLRQIRDLKANHADLEYPPFTPLVTSTFRKRDPAQIFAKIARRDLLMHHPYDAFDSYVRWIQAAAEDPQVESIQQTVYRMDAASQVIEALKEAAKKKRVRVVIELRARFDELNNLLLADELRKAGVEVRFGRGNLKIHAKIALISRREEGQLRYYTHLSTGNYNATTARQYEDLAILTANPQLGADARHFFDSVCRGDVPVLFKELLPAPTRLRRVLLSYIRAETAAAKRGEPAYIFAKVNALLDNVLIDNLYQASQAGVKVDLVVRGACSLIPGVKGLSESIRVFSVVDRYLEHSRIYHFLSSRRTYLSSADWMPRNFFSRLELAFPVRDAHLYDFISAYVIPAYLADNTKGWQLTKEGTWRQRLGEKSADGTPSRPHRSQLYFEELARQEYRDTPLSWRYQPAKKT